MKAMYTILNYYTDEIIDITDSLKNAIEICQKNIDSYVEDDFGDIHYANIDLPF